MPRDRDAKPHGATKLGTSLGTAPAPLLETRGGVRVTNEIDEWSRPEDMGLRREGDTGMVAAGGGIVALLLGTAMWGLGSMNWAGELAFLQAFNSQQGRLGAALCAASGAAGLLVSRAAFWNRL